MSARRLTFCLDCAKVTVFYEETAADQGSGACTSLFHKRILEIPKREMEGREQERGENEEREGRQREVSPRDRERRRARGNR